MRFTRIIPFIISIALLNIVQLHTIDLNTQIDAMYNKYGATLCTDVTLVKEFSQIQSKIGLNHKIPLFVSEYPPKWLSKLTIAFYAPYYETITIITSNFYKQCPPLRTHTLYHELRHHLQKTNSKVYQTIIDYVALKKMSFAQAEEYDADYFGAKNATNNCPHCLEELKRCFSIYNFDNSGYFTQNDFIPLLQEAQKQKCFCINHSDKTPVFDKKMEKIVRTACYSVLGLLVSYKIYNQLYNT